MLHPPPSETSQSNHFPKEMRGGGNASPKKKEIMNSFLDLYAITPDL